ncbi:MAG: hypothetical protein ACFCUM_17715 [Bacteroidales bacterium]
MYPRGMLSVHCPFGFQ